MRTRHRIPTIFSLSMVDVLCCALGSVILLWLLNLREAKQRAEAAGQFESALIAAQAQLQEKDKDAGELRRHLASAEHDREQFRNERDAAQKQKDETERALAALANVQRDTMDRLARKRSEHETAERDLAAARRQQGVLERRLRETETQARLAARHADDLADRLRDADAEAKQLRGQADTAGRLRDEAKKYREQFAAASLQLRTLEKEIDDRKRDITGSRKSVQELEATNAHLQQELAAKTKELNETTQKIESITKDKANLQSAVKVAQAAEEKRFAGISLTGKRVVFLVDMSGSMELIDERTPAANKWTGVRETVAKVMRSLPELEKFQVILFSDRVSYPLGNIEHWLDFDATAVDRTLKAISEAKPTGNTNMYSAFETAFKFRAAGMDTIYLFSDGLPSVGAGLTLDEARQMKETERNDALSKFVRKTLLNDWNKPIADRPRVRINAIGFFYESPDVGAFLWALAREHDGSFVGMSKP